jgi:hypothetical protein
LMSFFEKSSSIERSRMAATLLKFSTGCINILFTIYIYIYIEFNQIMCDNVVIIGNYYKFLEDFQ